MIALRRLKRLGGLSLGILAAGVLTAGCSRFSGYSVPEYVPPVAASGGQKPQLAGSAPEGGAPLFESSQPPAGPQGRVNVFGEFGDRPSASPRMGTGGFEQVTFLDEGYDSDVQVSPDGKWLVFASTRHNERPEIYLQRIGGVTVTQLTSDQADDGFPTFSPDGRRIAFSSTRNGNWDIYLMDIDGRNVTQVTSSNMQELHPSFSPDGTRLVYCATGTRSGQWELWIVDLRTSERRMIGYGLFPEFSPDPGRERIVFQRPRQRGSRWFSIWTADLVEGEARNLTEVAVSGNAAVVSPTWSRCGSMIAFSTIVNPGLENSAAGGTQQDVWVINSDGTGRRRITDGNGVNATPSWSKDGRLFFVSDRGGVEAVWAAQVVGGPLMTAGQRHGEDPFASTDKDSATP